MDNHKSPTIVTDGDTQINTITTIGELNYLVSCMPESIIHLNMYVTEHVTETKYMNVIRSQVS